MKYHVIKNANYPVGPIFLRVHEVPDDSPVPAPPWEVLTGAQRDAWVAQVTLAERTDEEADQAQIINLLATCADMRNHVGTTADRVTRLENFCGRLGPYLVKKGILP
jgi:hypothetical protein